MNRLNQVKRMTQMIQSTQSMDLIYQLNQLNQLNSIQYFVDLFWENHLFRWPFSEKTFDFFDLFWIFWINSIDSIKPVPKNLSTQSPILWKRIDSVTNQLTWEKTESTQSIFRKKMNRFKSIDSVELNRIQVCSHLNSTPSRARMAFFVLRWALLGLSQALSDFFWPLSGVGWPLFGLQ